MHHELKYKMQDYKTWREWKNQLQTGKKNTCTYLTRDKYLKYIKSIKTQCLKKIHLEENTRRMFY